MIKTKYDLTEKDLEKTKLIVRNGEDICDCIYLFDKWYDYFVNTNSIPYDTAKARDGDPCQWIYEELEKMYGES